MTTIYLLNREWSVVDERWRRGANELGLVASDDPQLRLWVPLAELSIGVELGSVHIPDKGKT